jgi:hypothetical protein
MRRAGILLLLSVAMPARSATTPIWTVSEASGGVTVLHAGLARAALRGGRLAAGDTISTGPNARAVIVRGEEYAVIAPSSRLQIADPTTGGTLTQIVARVGNAVFSIKKMATPHFGVATPYLAAVVKGTTFSVTVDDVGARVQVVEGAVEVATNDGGAHELLRAGSIGSVGAGALGSLVVDGPGGRRTLSSPAAQVAPVRAVAASGVSTKEGAPPTVVNAAAIATPRSTGGSAAVIAVPAATTTPAPSVLQTGLTETAPSLASLTGGLIAGQVAFQGALATAAATGTDRQTAQQLASMVGATGRPVPSGAAPLLAALNPRVPVTASGATAAPTSATPTAPSMPTVPTGPSPTLSTPTASPVSTPTVPAVSTSPVITGPGMPAPAGPEPSMPAVQPQATPTVPTQPMSPTSPAPTLPAVPAVPAPTTPSPAPTPADPVVAPPPTTPVVAPTPIAPVIAPPPIAPIVAPSPTTPVTPVATTPGAPPGLGVNVSVGPNGVQVTPGNGVSVSVGGVSAGVGASNNGGPSDNSGHGNSGNGNNGNGKGLGNGGVGNGNGVGNKIGSLVGGLTGGLSGKH